MLYKKYCKGDYHTSFVCFAHDVVLTTESENDLRSCCVEAKQYNLELSTKNKLDQQCKPEQCKLRIEFTIDLIENIVKMTEQKILFK